MKHKSESLDCLRRYIQEMRVLLHDHKVKTLIGLRSDNGGEYTGVDFKNFCKNHGITQDSGIPYGPQDNGVAEKSWHVLSNMARSLRIQAGLGKRFWAEALNTAAYILNRSRTSALGPGETPYYKMFGKHASVKHLRTFGCKAFVHDTSVKRGKFSDGTIKGVMFKDVIVVPNLSRDLLSMARIDKAGGDIIIRKGKGVIKKGDTCLPIRKVDNMYMLDYYGKSREEAM